MALVVLDRLAVTAAVMQAVDGLPDSHFIFGTRNTAQEEKGVPCPIEVNGQTYEAKFKVTFQSGHRAPPPAIFLAVKITSPIVQSGYTVYIKNPKGDNPARNRRAVVAALGEYLRDLAGTLEMASINVDTVP